MSKRRSTFFGTIGLVSDVNKTSILSCAPAGLTIIPNFEKKGKYKSKKSNLYQVSNQSIDQLCKARKKSRRIVFKQHT